MTLKPGTWLNHYEVLDHLGTGGMGEVYRARDNKLQREVALKVLPKAFAQDPERLGRFRREAQVLAQVNHPNIAAIYSVEESGGTHFLVMELAQGETLKDRIQKSGARSQNQSGIPIEEALDIAKQIAAGLEAAHEKPIVHRDLKPANVKVTPEGVVKILDFGLARAFAGDTGSSDPSDSPTLTGMTQPGTILGTAAYMSPEQAKGKPVDKRTDIWALGCVLYEMLTGVHAFDGEDVTEILGAIHHKEPDWSALPQGTPVGIQTLLRRCLQKDARRRSRDAAEIQLQIEEALSAPATQTPAPAKPASPPPPPLLRRAMPWTAAFALGLVVAGLVVWSLMRSGAAPSQSSMAHFVISLPPGQRLATDLGFPVVAISPDGTHLAYVARDGDNPPQLYVRTMDSPEARALPGTEEAASPFFSPDGQWLGFFAPDGLKKISISGGSPVTIAASTAGYPSGATWAADGTIIFQASVNSDLWQVPAAGGEPRQLPNTTNTEKALLSVRWPEFLPGGTDVLFATHTSGVQWFNPQLALYNLKTGERRDLSQAGTFPRYSPTGHLLYVQNQTLVAAPFDLGRLEATGAQVPVVEGVMQSRNGGAQYTLSDNGTLVYVEGIAASDLPGGQNIQSPPLTFVWVDRNGNEQPIPAPPHPYTAPKISPDGRRIAVTVEELGRQVWIYDLIRETLTRLTFDGPRNNTPVWTPDGKRITYSSGSPTNLYWLSADGSGKPERLTNAEYPQSATSWSLDGQFLAFRQQSATTANDIWILRLSDPSGNSAQDSTAEPFLQTQFGEAVAMFSPDGKWLAYTSNESGRNEIYVQPFPGPGGKRQISTDGGKEIVWNPNGRELFFRNGDKLMAVDIATEPGFSAGKPKLLFESSYVPAPTSTANYDVSPDGQRFLMLKADEQQSAPTQIHVVLNWFEELKRRVPSGQ